MKHLLKQFLQREAHPLVQFIKYGICGVLATVVDVLLFYFLAWKLAPALTPDDPVVHLLAIKVTAVTEQARSLNFVFDKSLSFLGSNFVAYVTNFFWVFHPGRHDRRKEILMFYAVSITSYALGVFLGWVLIAFFGFSTTAAYLGNAVTSVSINYAGRKFLVFER